MGTGFVNFMLHATYRRYSARIDRLEKPYIYENSQLRYIRFDASNVGPRLGRRGHYRSTCQFNAAVQGNHVKIAASPERSLAK